MRIGFTKNTQIKEKHTLCEIPVNNYMSFPSLIRKPRMLIRDSKIRDLKFKSRISKESF